MTNPHLDRDKRRRMAIRAATAPVIKGTLKEDDHMLIAMRRQIVEECARRLHAEAQQLRNQQPPISPLQMQLNAAAIDALDKMRDQLRRDIGNDAEYRQLPAAVRTAVEREN